ncbi:hypothetical protein [Streptomyces virginiae]
MFVLSGPGDAAPGDPAGHTRHRSSYGAVGLDLDLLAGPEAALPYLRDHVREDDWYPDDMVEAGVLADEARRLLLLFAWEGPIASRRTRAATLELLPTSPTTRSRRAPPCWSGSGRHRSTGATGSGRTPASAEQAAAARAAVLRAYAAAVGT